MGEGGIPPGPTKAEYARRCGVSRQMVTKWAKAGLLVLFPDGSIDVLATDAKIAANRDASRGGKTGKPDHDKPAPGPKPSAARPSGDAGTVPVDVGTFADARARTERAKAKTAELDLDERVGRLIDRAAYDKALLDAVTPIVAQLDALAPELAPKVAPHTDLRTLQLVIEAEVVKVRRGIADTLRRIAAGGAQDLSDAA